jgi:hypothetical protein
MLANQAAGAKAVCPGGVNLSERLEMAARAFNSSRLGKFC